MGKEIEILLASIFVALDKSECKANHLTLFHKTTSIKIISTPLDVKYMTVSFNTCIEDQYFNFDLKFKL